MKSLLSLATVFTLAATALAEPPDRQPRPFPLDNIAFKHMTYRVATGERIPGGRSQSARRGDVIWAANEEVWGLLPFEHCDIPGQRNEMVLDWGDVPAGAYVDAFTIGYATDADFGPNQVRFEFTFLDNSNGYDDNQGPIVAGFTADLWGTTYFPYWIVGWFVTFELNGTGLEFVLGDQDLDGDGLADFAYTFKLLDRNGGTFTGPLVVESVNPLNSPGAEDAYDLYVQSPDKPCSDPNAPYVYDGTYSFSEPYLYGQFFLVLYGRPSPPCPSSDACVGGDVDRDCAVTLADLSALLEAYGCETGQTCYNPAADFDNSGDVGLDDLSSLLSVYGLDCDQPVQLVPDPGDPPTGEDVCEWEIECRTPFDQGDCPPAVLDAVRADAPRYLYEFTCSGDCPPNSAAARISIRYQTADGVIHTCHMAAKLRKTEACGPGINTPYRFVGPWLGMGHCQIGW